MTVRQVAFLILAAGCVWPAVDSAMALGLGLAFSLTLGNPFPGHTSRWSRMGLQTAVVGLGFGVGLGAVLAEGRRSIGYTLVAIALILAAGWLIGRWLKVERDTAHLISFGTAICGGSAIAAMAPVLGARDEETGVSLATVFTLNAAGLLLFPGIGRWFGLSPDLFGIWAALAIHDTSSVVGAAASYGGAALGVATTVKLTRALWISPVVLVVALLRKRAGKLDFPYFVLGFLAAAVIRAALPEGEWVWAPLAGIARRLLVATLFLIGAGLTWDLLRRVGLRPLLQGVMLWGLVSGVTLFLLCQ